MIRAKKVVSVFLVFAMILGVFPGFATNAAASDISGHWAQETMQKWIDGNLFQGYGSDIYKPDGGITRAEFVALVNRIGGYTEKSGQISQYTDVAPSDWYYNDFAVALAAGYIKGTGGDRLSPTASITRNEAVVIMAHTMGLEAGDPAVLSNIKDGSAVPDWSRSELAAAIENGFITGINGAFEGARGITRAETIDAIVQDGVTYTGRSRHYARGNDHLARPSDDQNTDFRLPRDLCGARCS